ncbi:MAG TPA: hypothetical protein VG028_13375 [Terriglobia bacterium]|nr:hypothetical protein [Terriglobia bacterium]
MSDITLGGISHRAVMPKTRGQPRLEPTDVTSRAVISLYPQFGAELQGRPFLTRLEAAAALTLSIGELSKMIRNRKFPVTRLGRRVLIPTGPFIEFLASRTSVGESPKEAA